MTATPSPHPDLPERDPNIGEMVRVRTRHWLVEEVIPAANGAESSSVRLACADDDAQGKELEVFWKYELDRTILDDEPWADLGKHGFDSPDYFAAFLNTLRWSCTTATDPSLFQAPFRAGIKIDAYQMEPLRKALLLPRVNLFIADDTGLGKTIEAGLIVRELLLRRKVRTIVVAAPPSVLEQWKGEMEQRFGLIFQILDRHYVARIRRERGFGTNPWSTHSRFLVSHRLLADPTYADPMRAWLGAMRPGSLLVLDEAHHAAPSHKGRYGIESKFTRAVREIGNCFEHRLFLSATPHNGHSNSFSTLLELLDPHRFTRGVKVRGKKDLEAVMVRRLKEDIREEVGGFPRRIVEPVVIDGLPDDAPELELSRLLDEYRTLRDRRFATATARGRAAAGLLVVGLQQRLLSSIEAFARSLERHRKTVERQWAEGAGKNVETGRRPAKRDPTTGGGGDDDEDQRFLATTGADDDLSDALREGGDTDGEADEDRNLASDAEAAEAEEERLLIEAANLEAEAGVRRDASARFFGSSMKDDLRYTPSDVFETFPFPPGWSTDSALEAAGRAYYDFRADLMVRNDEGLTKTYNRFHDRGDRDPDIDHLRTLHAAMDQAVLDAYGWSAIPTDCEFRPEHEAVNDGASGRRRRHRYRWPDRVRDEVLARLLELNAERAEQEEKRLEQSVLAESHRNRGVRTNATRA